MLRASPIIYMLQQTARHQPRLVKEGLVASFSGLHILMILYEFLVIGA